jgi:hypothetical protein
VEVARERGGREILDAILDPLPFIVIETTLKTVNLAWMPTLAGDVQMVLADGKVLFQNQEVATLVSPIEQAATVLPFMVSTTAAATATTPGEAGRIATGSTLDAAAEAITSPAADAHGPAHYRTKMAGVMLARALAGRPPRTAALQLGSAATAFFTHRPRSASAGSHRHSVAVTYLFFRGTLVFLQDGANVGAVRLHREHRAGFHRLVIEVDGTGAAMRRFAAYVRSGETEMLAQKVNEQGPGLDQRVDGPRHSAPRQLQRQGRRISRLHLRNCCLDRDRTSSLSLHRLPEHRQGHSIRRRMNAPTPSSAERAEKLEGMGCKRKRVEDIRFVQGAGRHAGSFPECRSRIAARASDGSLPGGRAACRRAPPFPRCLERTEVVFLVRVVGMMEVVRPHDLFSRSTTTTKHYRCIRRTLLTLRSPSV